MSLYQMGDEDLGDYFSSQFTPAFQEEFPDFEMTKEDFIDTVRSQYETQQPNIQDYQK